MSNCRFELTDKVGQNNASYIVDSHSNVSFSYTPTSHGDTPALNAKLLYVTTAKYEGDWQSLSHSHAFCELFLVLDGKGLFVSNGEQQEIEPQDLIIVNPLVKHAEFSLEAAPLEYIVLGIDGLQFFSHQDMNKGFTFLKLSRISQRIRQYMQLLLETVQQEYSYKTAVCQNLMNIILLLIQDAVPTDLTVTAFKNINSECAAVKHYIDTHFQEPITLNDLSNISHQNKFYVAHAFKRSFGISPIRYLVERRIDESKYLLNNTRLPISEVASLSGFSSSSVFSQTFRRLTSLTPNEFRRHSQNRQRG